MGSFSSTFFAALATIVLFVHAAFIAWVAVGSLTTRTRPLLRWFHLAALCWAILVETLPWTCPLTFLENWLEARAGVEPYQGGFLLHYLDKLVYPDVSYTLLTVAAVSVCCANFFVYATWFWKNHNRAAVR